MPVLPEKNFWTCLNMEGSEYVHLRLKRLTKYLNNLVGNQSIRNSKVLKRFLFDDTNDFAEEKGEFEEKIRVEDKIYSFVQNVYESGSSFISGFFNRPAAPQPLQTSTNLALTEHEVNISNIWKAVAGWKK